jgi:hypothetical protein
MPDVVQAAVVSPVSAGGTITFNYPTPAGSSGVPLRSAESYMPGLGAVLFPRDLQNTYKQGSDFTLVYGVNTVTLTWNNAQTIPAADGVLSGGRTGIVSLQLPLLSDDAKESVGKFAPMPGGDTYIFS